MDNADGYGRKTKEELSFLKSPPNRQDDMEPSDRLGAPGDGIPLGQAISTEAPERD